MQGKYKWLTFLATNNTLIVNNEIEFEQLKTFLLRLDMIEILHGYLKYSDWQQIAKENGYPTNYLIFEFNNSKGLSFGYTIEESKNWFGYEPLNIKDLEIFSNKPKNYCRGI